MWKHGAEATEKLLVMSEHTVRRRGCRVREKLVVFAKDSLQQNRRLLKAIIPIFKGAVEGLAAGAQTD